MTRHSPSSRSAPGCRKWFNSMKPAARNAPVVLLLMMLSALAAAVSPAPARGAAKPPAPVVAPGTRDLLAHGTNQYVWTADVVPVVSDDQPSVNTIIRFRTAGDVRWQESTE